jgi:hypothetical protein
MIGLGIAAVGIGTRYGNYQYTDAAGQPQWIRFWQMDTPLITIVILLICCIIVGLSLALVGLAYHHHRRHHELFGHRDNGTRIPVNQP